MLILFMHLLTDVVSICRDGVSEGQFYQVLLYELDAIRRVSYIHCWDVKTLDAYSDPFFLSFFFLELNNQSCFVLLIMSFCDCNHSRLVPR